MKKLVIPFFIAVSFALYSCGSTSTGTSASKTISASAKTTENIAQGKTIYEANCGKCHDLPNPQSFNDEKWVEIMNWMAPKAKFTEEQKAFAYLYVTNSN